MSGITTIRMTEDEAEEVFTLLRAQSDAAISMAERLSRAGASVAVMDALRGEASRLRGLASPFIGLRSTRIGDLYATPGYLALVAVAERVERERREVKP